MDQSLRVHIEADVNPIESSILRVISRLGQFGQSAIRAGVDLANGFTQGSASATKGLSDADKALGRFIDNSGRLREVNGRFANTGSQMERAFKAPLSSLTQLAAGYLTLSKAIELTKDAIKVVSDFERLDAALQVVSRSNEDYSRTQALLKNTSDQLGVSYQALAESYKGIKAASNGTLLEGQQTEKIFLSIVHAGAALKLSNDEVKGSLLAVQQMMSKGTIQAEELRGQLSERLPGAFGALARAMGVTEPELNKMLETGQVLASDALPKLAQELERTFGASAINNAQSLAGSWTRLTDQLKLFISEFSKTAGIDSFFAKLSNGMANYLSGLREAQSRGEGLLGLTGERRVELTYQAQLRGRYQSASESERAAMMEKAQLDLQKAEFSLKRPQIRNSSAGTEATQRVIAEYKERIQIMRREQRRYNDAQATEEAAAAKRRATPVAFDIDKAKDRQSALEKQIQNLAGQGKSIPAKLQSEYDSLTATIDRATEATKRNKTQSAAQGDGLTSNERILKRLTRELKEYGDTADRSRSKMVGMFQELVRQEKELANNKPVELGKLNPLEGFGTGSARVAALLAANGATTPGVNGQLATVGLPGLGGLQLRLSEQIIDEKIKTKAALDGLKKNLTEFPGFLGSLRDAYSNAGSQLFNRAGEKIREGVERIAESLQSAKAVLMDAGMEAFAGLTAAMAAASVNMDIGKQILKNTLKTILDVIASQAIAIGKALLLANLPLLALPPPFNAIGVKGVITGGALIAGGGIIRGLAAAAFAKGGTVSGPTYSLTGEYPGAKRNPEFIAPVNKGASMIAQQLTQMGAFGGGNERLIARISGRDLEIIRIRQDTSNKYY